MTNDDFKELQHLSAEERAYALEILKEYSQKGSSKKLDDLLYSDYREIPVDIETFLHDPQYLGKGLTNEEGKFTVFPYWVDTLKKLFPSNLDLAYNTLILTGPIGIGKTIVAVIAELYMLYRMMCLKDPYLHYGLQPIDKISFGFINITLDAAKGVAWDKCQNLIQSSPWFMAHGHLNRSTNPTWKPDEGIELIAGSRNNHIIGRCLFCNFTDEANFGIGNDVEKLKEKQKKLISQVDARMQSRFMKGTKLPTLNIIASSKQSEQSFLESFINTKKQVDSKTTLVIDEPQWVIRTDKGKPTDAGSFYVAIGNKFLASEVLPINMTEAEADIYRQRGYTLMRVPPGYREAFESDVDVALTDIAGVSSVDSMKYISGVRLNDAKISTYANPFVRDIIEVGNSPSDIAQYSDFFDLSKVGSEYKSKPLFIHLDMSLSGDKTGIAGTWITGKKATKVGENASQELQYRLAFSVSIKAPRGFQVSFEKNRNFIRWLKEQGFNIKGVSCDTYQSAQIQQQLKADGFNTEIISVDRIDSLSKVCLPYQYLKSAIYEGRVEIYSKCDLLTDELIGLERKSDGHIDHTSDGINSKDQADAFCGSLYAASQHAEEYAFDYGETLDTIQNVSSTFSAQNQRQQISIDFQNELNKLFDPMKVSSDSNNSEFMDFGMGKAKVLQQQYISDGIIVI